MKEEMRKCPECGANLDSGERCDCERDRVKLDRAEFIARAVADRMKDRLRGQKEAYWARSAHIDAERRKKR